MLITAMHPAYAAFRSPYEWGTFCTYLGRFARAIRGQLNYPPDDEHHLIVRPTVADVKKLHALKWVAVDLETRPARKNAPWTGKDPTQAKLRCLGIGTLDWGVCEIWTGNGPVKNAMKELLRDPKVLKVFQNGAFFDLRVLSRYGMEVVNWSDTRDMRRTLVSTSRLSLAFLTSLYVDSHFWKGTERDETEDGTK